jgi:hypothetical protein
MRWLTQGHFRKRQAQFDRKTWDMSSDRNKGHQRKRIAEARRGKRELPIGRDAEAQTTEQRIASALARLRDDDDGLLEFLADEIPAWQRMTAEIVLIRTLGAERAGDLCTRAFGLGATGPTALRGYGQAAPATPLQMKRLDGRDEDEAQKQKVRAVAQRGVAQTGSALPFAAELQERFGHHNLDGVKAHLGGAAADAASTIGAKAYAIGDDIAFAEQPDLYLAAHEAAHVVQQRAGLRPSSGVGERGDALEQQADAVAAAVVRGASAEAILDAPAKAARAASAPAVQRFDSAKSGSLSPVDAVGKALKDDKADDAQELMQKLDADGANDVLARFQKDAVSCFNNKEMGKAGLILVQRGGRLDRVLDWMFDEGTNWKLLRAVVIACRNADYKAAIRNDKYRGRFVDELGDGEMDQLVDLIGGPIDWKLNWMFNKGTNYDHVAAKINAANSAGEDLQVLCSDAWRDHFMRAFGNAGLAKLVKLLPRLGDDGVLRPGAQQ